MKTSFIIGVILILIGIGLFYVNEMDFDMEFIIGTISGVGIGLVIGSPIGYISKKSKKLSDKTYTSTKEIE